MRNRPNISMKDKFYRCQNLNSLSEIPSDMIPPTSLKLRTKMQNLNTTTNLPKIKPIEKKSDEKLSSILKKSNFEVYYGDAPLAVPFKWETQPGTPKVKFLETPIPPLAPPPSFQVKKKNAIKKQTKAKLLQMLSFLPKLNLRKSHLQSTSSSSPASYSSSSVSSPSSLSSPPKCWSYSAPASPYRGKFNIQSQ